jgi:hypothetical protein
MHVLTVRQGFPKLPGWLVLCGIRAGSSVSWNHIRRRRQEAKAADCKSAIVGSTPTGAF